MLAEPMATSGVQVQYVGGRYDPRQLREFSCVPFRQTIPQELQKYLLLESAAEIYT